MDTQLASDQMASSKNETETGDQLTLASPNMYALNTAEYLLTIKPVSYTHLTLPTILRV